MPTYIGLYKLSGQGIKNIKEAPSRVEDAFKAAEVLMLDPRFSVKGWAMRSLYKNRSDKALLADTMRKVGLPD